MNATLPVATEEIVKLPIIEEIEKWSAAQQMELLSRIARLVMAERATSSLILPGSGEGRPGVRDLKLTLVPKFEIRPYQPPPDDPEWKEILRAAASGKSGLPLEGIVDDLIDGD